MSQNKVTTMSVTLDNPTVRYLQYDGHRKELTLLFATGNSYVYLDVPQSKVIGILRSSDAGKFIEACQLASHQHFASF